MRKGRARIKDVIKTTSYFHPKGLSKPEKKHPEKPIQSGGNDIGKVNHKKKRTSDRKIEECRIKGCNTNCASPY